MTDIGGRGKQGGGGKPPGKAESLELNNILQQQVAIMNQLKESIASLADNMSKFCETTEKCFSKSDWQKVTKDVQKYNKQTVSTTEATAKLSKQVSSLTSGFQKLAPVMGGIVGFAKGLQQGFTNLFALTKAGFNFTRTLATGLKKVSLSIISIPFKMLGGLIDMASSMGGDTSLAQALEDVREEFGLIGKTASTIKSSAFELKNFNQTGLHARQVFENAADQVKFFNDMAKGMGPQFQLNIKDFKENSGAIAAYAKGLGLSAEQMGAMSMAGQRMGKSMSKVLLDVTKHSVHMAKAFGLDAKVISKDMGKAMQDMKNFGHMSVKQIAEAVTYSNKLGVSIDKLTSLMDQFDTFDKAAESTSTLNAQFGTNIDAMELMAAQSPAEKFEILRKSFAATGKNLKDLNYQERKLLQTTAGLTDEAFNAMIANQDQGDALKDMQKEGDKAEKKTMDQAEAMKELADQIKRVVRSGEQGGGFMDRFFKGFTAGLMQVKEFRELMMNIRKSLNVVGRMGRELGTIFVNAIPGVKDVFGGLAKIFDPGKFMQLSARISGIFKKFFSKDGEMVGNVSEMMTEVKKAFFEFFMAGKPGAEQVLSGFKKFGQFVIKIFAGILEYVVNKLPEIITSITNWIKNPKLPKIGGDIDKAWYQPLWDVIKTIPDKLGPALKDLGLAIWERVKQGLTSKVGMGVIAGAVGVVLAPALLQGLTGAGAGKAISGAVDQFKGLFGKKTAAVAEAAGGVSKAAGAAGAAAGDAEAAKAAGDTISAATPSNAVIDTLKAVSEMKISWFKLIKFFVGFAGFIAIGIEGFKKALDVVRGVDMNDIVKAGIVLLAVGKSLEMMAPTVQSMATGFWQSVSWESIGQTMVAIAGFLAIGLLAFAGALLLVKDVPFTAVLKAGITLMMIGVVMGMMGPLLLEAVGIGKLAQKYGKEMLIGMVALGLAVEAVAGFAWLAVKILGGLSMSAILKTGAVMAGMVPLFKETGELLVIAGLIGAAILLTEGVGAVAMAAGMLAMGLAVVAVAKTAQIIIDMLGDIPAAKALKTAGIMTGMVKLFDETAKLLFKAGGIGAAILTTLGVGAAAMYIGMKALNEGIEYVAETAISVIEKLGDIPLAKAGTAAAIMTGTALMFAGSAVLLAEAGAIGATIIGSFGLAGAAIYVGMQAMTGAIDAVADAAISIMTRLAEIKEEPTAMKMKAEAFASIVSAVAKMTDSIANILDEMDFGFFEGADDMGARVTSVQSFVNSLISGNADGNGEGGIKGIITSILGGLKDISKEQLEQAGAFANILSALGKLMEVMTGPAVEVQKNSTHWYQSAEEDAKQAETAMRGITDYVKTISTEAKGLVSTMVDMLKGLSENELKILKEGGQAIGSLLGALGQLMQAMKPPDVTTNVSSGNLGSTNSVVNVTIPSMKETLDQMRESLPSLVKTLISVIQSVPPGEEFLKKIEQAKKLFDSIKPLGQAINSLLKSTQDKPDSDSGDVKEMLQEFEAFFYDLQNGPGTFTGVQFQINNVLSGIEDASKYEQLTEKAVTMIKSVGTIIEKIAGMKDINVPDPDDIKDTIQDLTGFFYKVNEALPGMLFQLTTMGTNLQSESQNLIMTNEQFIKFNESMKIVSDTMKMLEETRDDVKAGATAATDISNAIFELDIAMSNVEMSMASTRFQGERDVARAIKAVEDMVSAVQQLDNALANLPRIDIPARLKQVAGMMGIGASGVYTVKSKDVVINVSFNVTMSTDKIEKSILSQGTIIRTALNFANSHVGQEGTPDAPDPSPAWYTEGRANAQIGDNGEWSNGGPGPAAYI